MTRVRSALVGAFVIGGLIIFGGGVFLIGDRRLLFERHFELNTTFGKVTGLQIGTRVRVAGLDAGEVRELTLPTRPSEPFRIRMRLREDVRPLVRNDSVAAIQTDGIVGNAFVQVNVGTDAAAVVSDGDTIRGSDPIEFADLIEEGRETFRVVSRQVVDLKGEVSVAFASLTQTIDTTNSVITEVGGNVDRLTESSESVVRAAEGTIADARVLVNNIKNGQGTIGQLMTDRALYDHLTATGREAEQTVRNLRETTDRARMALEGFVSPDGTGQQITLSLRNTLAQIQEVTSDLAEGTEALKRNFLFRGFFRQRGFFDLDTLSREAYQSGALERDGRTALRIWIDADVLFERGPDNVERLTEAGRRRIDSAMADYVRYPRESPLVVEGYAESREGEAAYLISDDRAQIVRDYLLARFRRQTTLTGVMPMASLAPGSPSGEGRWSGVALALFVRNTALASSGRAAAP